MTVKEFKEWVNEIPEEYDDMELEVTTYSEGGPETYFLQYISGSLGVYSYCIEIE